MSVYSSRVINYSQTSIHTVLAAVYHEHVV